MNSLLELKNVSASYDKSNVLTDVSLSLAKADFLGIIGPNGSGKSTILKVASRALKPRKGGVFLNKKELFAIRAKEAARCIAVVPQDMSINFSFTAWEIVLMGRIPHLGRLENYKKKDFEIAEHSLSLTDTLHLKNRDVNTLSAGERQRVIIAKALAQEPTLLLLDEPTSHLDIGHQIDLLELMKRLNIENDLTIAIVFHDLNLASEYCKNILLLNNGLIAKYGSPREVLTQHNIQSIYGHEQILVKENPITHNPFVFSLPKNM